MTPPATTAFAANIEPRLIGKSADPANPSFKTSGKVGVRCPYCQAALKVAPALAGHVLKCPLCGERFRAAVTTPACPGDNKPKSPPHAKSPETPPTQTPPAIAPVKRLTKVSAKTAGNAPAARAPDDASTPRRQVGQLDEPAPKADPLLGSNIRHFAIKKVLGRGAMGAVYEAEDTILRRRVAIKVMLAGQIADTTAARERFLIEARAAAALQHPNIVYVHEIGHQGTTAYIAMELVRGGSAADFIDEHGAMAAQDATRVILETARALAEAHAHGVIHRDVKPDNIMIGPDWMIKVTDFGLAKRLDQEEDTGTKGKALGTPGYMSPETCRGLETDARSDLYSLGCSYYALLTGKGAFRGGTVRDILRRHLSENGPDPREERPDVPAPCAAVALKAMRTDPAARYQTAREMIADLEAIRFDRAPTRDEPFEAVQQQRMQTWIAETATVADHVAVAGSSDELEMLAAIPVKRGLGGRPAEKSPEFSPRLPIALRHGIASARGAASLGAGSGEGRVAPSRAGLARPDVHALAAALEASHSQADDSRADLAGNPTYSAGSSTSGPLVPSHTGSLPLMTASNFGEADMTHLANPLGVPQTAQLDIPTTTGKPVKLVRGADARSHAGLSSKSGHYKSLGPATQASARSDQASGTAAGRGGAPAVVAVIVFGVLVLVGLPLIWLMGSSHASSPDEKATSNARLNSSSSRPSDSTPGSALQVPGKLPPPQPKDMLSPKTLPTAKAPAGPGNGPLARTPDGVLGTHGQATLNPATAPDARHQAAEPQTLSVVPPQVSQELNIPSPALPSTAEPDSPELQNALDQFNTLNKKTSAKLAIATADELLALAQEWKKLAELWAGSTHPRVANVAANARDEAVRLERLSRSIKK